MRPWRALGKRLGAVAAAIAASVGAIAASPTATPWQADPDSQYLFDLTVRQLRLGENLRAYPTPEGTCLVMGDLVSLLDAPITTDLPSNKATGWAFRPDHRIVIDRAAGTVQYGATRDRLAEGDVRDTPDGWCVDSAAASRWLGVNLKVFAGASTVRIESEAKLPVELAVERQNRAKHLRKAALPLEAGPVAKIPYRLWRAPALDFVVDGGVTYDTVRGARVDRRMSVTAAGEIASLSYEAQIVGGRSRWVDSLRVRAYRSDPEGGLLGPLHATHFGVGDVNGLSHPLLSGFQGRGVELTNKPLFNPHSFDKTRFEGVLAPGWQAELYRNGQLLDFAADEGTGRYLFDAVDLGYGENQFEIVLFGPQGQRESRLETVTVGEQQLPPGETRWWVGANEPGRDLLGVSPDPVAPPSGSAFDQPYVIPRAQVAAQVEHGVDKRTSVSALAAAMLLGDERLTFVEGSVRRSIGPALIESAVAFQEGGGLAIRAQAMAKIGAVNVRAEAAKVDHYLHEGRFEREATKLRVAADAPLHLGKVPLQLHGEYRLLDRPEERVERADGRVSANFGRVAAGIGAGWERETLAGGVVNTRFDLKTVASGHVGRVRVRGQAVWDVGRDAGMRSADLSAYWTGKGGADWEAGLGYDGINGRTRARLSHVRRFESFAVRGTLEAGSDRSIAAGINVNFSLDASRGGFKPVSQQLATSGHVRANIFRDDNDNGRRDPGEKAEEGILLTGGIGAQAQASDADGAAALTGLTPYQAVAIGIDGSTLSDPSLAPRKATQTIVPRPGVTAVIDIPLVGSGDVEAVLVGTDGSGLEGVTVEVLDGDGKVVATAQTDFDGFFLFERLPYGHYRFRLAAESARALKLDTALEATASLDATHSIARLGPVSVRKAAVLASAQ